MRWLQWSGNEASAAHDNMQLEDIQFETAAARLHHYSEDWHHMADDNGETKTGMVADKLGSTQRRTLNSNQQLIVIPD